MKLKFKNNNQKGFTIVELLIYMGILTILLGVLTNIFVSALDVQLESQANSSVVQDGNYILAKLSTDMYKAASISIPASLGATVDNFQININGVNYNYSVDASDNLILANDLGSNTLNSYDSRISGFSVQRLGNVGKVEDNLNILFTIISRTKKQSGYDTRDFQINLGLRRK